MKKIVCAGCNLTEDLDNPTGAIHRIQMIDLAPRYDTEKAPPDKDVEEDLCESCRKKIRREFFGEAEAELLDMPLMKRV